MSDTPKKLHKNEILKAESQGLRGSIAEELANDAPNVSEASNQLLKFHGIYQQDNRDERVRTPEGTQKAYSLMLRGRIPGGRLDAGQALVWFDLGERFGGGSLRLTTRQTLQLHGILKGNIKPVIQELHAALLSATGACGDVVRNVTQAPNPLQQHDLAQLNAYADLLSNHFIVASNAYAEIFLDGEPVLEETAPAEPDPIYGTTYLPRKFKIGITLAGNNSIDLYTNDMGFAATLDASGTIDGFFVFAGGGLGMTHNKPQTFPRAADCLGWVAEPDLLKVAEAIVTTQRDYGNRTDRKQARLKYLIHKQGVEWFKQQVTARCGVAFEPRELPAWNSPSYLGWHRTEQNRWSLGFHTLAGRLRDREDYPIFSCLRRIVEKTRCAVQLTADQDLILLGLSDSDKLTIETLLAEFNIDPASPSKLRDRALACPALPTCGLAITEAERYLPDFLEQIETLLAKHALMDRAPVFRMTGCPNGCARPYSAELGLVGRTLDQYALFLGADKEGTRVGDLILEQVSKEDLSPTLDKLFAYWKNNSTPDETLGHFSQRVDREALIAALS